MFLAAYFISDYLVTASLLKNLQLGLQNKYYSNLRIQQMRQLKTSAVEALLDAGLQPKSDGHNISALTGRVIESIYDTQHNLSNLDTGAFSTAYSTIVGRINLGNVCDAVEQYSRDFGLPLPPSNLSNS